MRKRVLLTGMSGTGKSTLVRELTARGYTAIDTDRDGWSLWINMRSGLPASPPAPGEYAWDELDWVWDEDRMRALLTSHESGMLFVAGTAINQREFYPLFDYIVLLSAPRAVIVERLGAGRRNPYGATPRSLARVLEHLETVEPALRKVAGHEIDTNAPLEDIIGRLLRILEGEPPCSESDPKGEGGRGKGGRGTRKGDGLGLRGLSRSGPVID